MKYRYFIKNMSLLNHKTNNTLLDTLGPFPQQPSPPHNNQVQGGLPEKLQIGTTTPSSALFAELIQNQQPQQNQVYQPPQQIGFQPHQQPHQQRQQQQPPPYPGVQVQPQVQVHSNPFAGRPGAVPHSPLVPQPSVPVAPAKPIFAGRPEPITPAPPAVPWTTPAILYQPTTPAYVPPTQGYTLCKAVVCDT